MSGRAKTLIGHNVNALMLMKLLAKALFAMTLLAGCVALPPAPTDALARANTAIERAMRAGADQYAPESLKNARADYAAARELMSASSNTQARYVAERAQAYAQLAQAVAEAEVADQAADRAENELARVRREIESQREFQ